MLKEFTVAIISAILDWLEDTVFQESKVAIISTILENLC